MDAAVALLVLLTLLSAEEFDDASEVELAWTAESVVELAPVVAFDELFNWVWVAAGIGFPSSST